VELGLRACERDLDLVRARGVMAAVTDERDPHQGAILAMGSSLVSGHRQALDGL